MLDLTNLFEVPVHVSFGEASPSSVEQLSPLHTAEIPAGYQRWVEKRQREFRAGRHHARLALRAAGVDVPLVRRGDDGLPLFPAGYHGSITHTGRESTFAAAAVCDERYYVGLDSENHKQLEQSMVDAVLLPHEQRRYYEVTSRDSHAPEALGLFALWVFSMKEAYYKCVYPRCAARFGFLDVDVHVHPTAKRFLVSLRTQSYPDVPSQLAGRFETDDQRIVCGVTWDVQQGLKG